MFLMQGFFPKLNLKEWGIIIGLSALFLGIATWHLTRLPIFVDEALYLRWAQIAWKDASWRFISLTDGKQPLYIWLVIPFMQMIKDPLAAGRAASVLSGLVTMLGMGYLGWLIGGKKVGFYAMLVSLLSPYLFFYYRFGIMESTLVASTIWVMSFSVLLARTRRLDIAMILGITAGLSLLVKSSSLFFTLMIPFSLLLTLKDFSPKSLLSKDNLKYLVLVGIAWLFAFVIYNIQRLSPWMHMIAEKNAFFTVEYGAIFDEPKRLWNNLADVWRWQWSYSTPPILAAFLAGIYSLYKTNKRTLVLIFIWLVGPMLGTVAVAELFAPRYIIYVTPLVLLFAAFGLASLKSTKFVLPLVVASFIMPVVLISKLIFDPLHFPYVAVDEGYVNGWSAGNGTKQIAEWLRARCAEVGRNQEVKVYTEGTFGILPHGLELYSQGIRNLSIEGVYPINDIPPSFIVAYSQENPETYLILNNTDTPDVPAGLELIDSYPKLKEGSMRLYKVIPR